MAKPSKIGAVARTAVRTAEILIERHGTGALDFARQQMARSREAGATDSAADWAEVVRAVVELGVTTRRD